MTRQSFVKGAAILTLAGFAVRLVGAFFRIALAVLLGDEGVGLYQMAYPVYSTLLAISTAGIPTAISKLVAEHLAGGNYHGAYRIFRTALFLLTFFGLTVAIALYGGAPFIAHFIAGDQRAYLPLISTVPAIFLVALVSAYRGFFQGQQQMLPTAYSQIAEQLGRVLVGLVLVLLLLPRGLEYAAAGAGFGAAAGAFCALCVLSGTWWRQRKEFGRQLARQRVADGQSPIGIMRQIFTLSVPVTFGSLVMPLTSVVDLSLVPMRLRTAGFDQRRAAALYGQLTGMAAPLVNIPTIITVALAISLVPAIAEALALRKTHLLRSRAYLALRFTLLLGIPAAFGLYLLAEPLALLIYNNAEAGQVLAVLALAVVFITLYQTTAAILQGLGQMMIPVGNLFWGALLKTALTWMLTARPALHVRGAALATLLGFGAAALLNLYQVQRLTGFSLQPKETIVKPVLAAAMMGAAVRFCYRRTAAGLLALGLARAGQWATLLSVVVGACIYFLGLCFSGALRGEDFLMIPRFGPALLAMAEKLHLLRS